jgi:DNA-binding CsgD family transcriptional regulator
MHQGSEMTNSQALGRARTAFAATAWAESYGLFEAAGREASLEPEDLERLATAAYLIGRDAESETYRARAHQIFLDRGDSEGAARSASLLGFGLLQRGAIAPASGWFARAERILDEAHLDCVVRGYLLIPSAIQRIVQGDPAAGDATFTRAAEIARRFGDRDLASLACSGRGRALIRLGNPTEGVALLDEAMVAVIAGDVTPILAGDIYCIVLEACQETFDLRRAYEWTMSLGEWCAAQPGLVRYRGECLLYRAEIMQLRGKWKDAAQDAQDACELLASRPAAGAAFYRVGELHRLRGEFEKAEAAYTRANERGRKPQPGLSLLRLAQREIETSAASIRAVLVDTRVRTARAGMLAAAVDILLAAGDLENARAAGTELAEIARLIGAPLLDAASAHASGAIRLAEGDIADASSSLRRAWEIWRDLGAPYEEAQTCLLMAVVCERRGDQDGRRLELDAARKLLDELGAGSRAAQAPNQFDRATHRPAGSLSEREAQVLRLLAAGKTNRDIGEALFISEKTVARHVSNIFDKLGVSSRTGAAAWAYQHNLI